MPNPQNDPTQYAAGLPLQVGVTPEQTRQMRDEIGHSGVANSEEEVENLATPNRETGENTTPGLPASILPGIDPAD